MKLPMIEALRTRHTNERVVITPRLSVAFLATDGVRAGMPTAHYTFTSDATFTMHQVAEAQAPLDVLHKQAVRVLAHEVYGPVAERLFYILTLLYEGGAHYDDKVVRALEDTINDLKP